MGRSGRSPRKSGARKQPSEAFPVKDDGRGWLERRTLARNRGVRSVKCRAPAIVPNGMTLFPACCGQWREKTAEVLLFSSRTVDHASRLGSAVLLFSLRGLVIRHLFIFGTWEWAKQHEHAALR
jgi:hypothetical protein